MKSRWTEASVDDLTDNFDAIRVPVKEADRRTGPYPYYGASGIVDYVDDYLFDGDYLLVAEDGENLRTRNTPIAFLATGRFWVNNHAHILRGNENADTRYVMYALSETDIGGYLTGSTMPKLTQGNLNRISLRVPPLTEQRAIATALGTLDDKIELNRRMNATLERIARALFKSWFVDFEPVQAKLQGRMSGLPRRLDGLFPNDKTTTSNGNVPKGWRAGLLADIAITPRRGINPGELPPETAYIGLEHMPRRSVALMEWGNTEAVTSNKSLFEKGEILFGKLRPYFHKVGVAPVDGVCSTDIVVLKPKDEMWSGFLLACVSSSEFVNYTDQTSTGTKMPRTSWKSMSQYPICIPTDAVAEAFNETTQPLIERIVTNVHEIRVLAAVRDALLPKLVSGEIRLKNAKNMAEAAA